MRTMLGRPRRNSAAARHDRGSAAVELAAAIPIVVLVLAALLQVASVVNVTSAANQAARDGARAMSLGRSAEGAVRDSLPGGLEPKRVRILAGSKVEVELEAKRVVPFMPTITVKRSVAMP